MGDEIIRNIATVYKRICHAAMRAGRDPEEVKLVAVTKTVGIDRIVEAIDAGLRVFGENRIQEAQKKIGAINELSLLKDSKIQWHMIGHLQRNKARYAVKLFDLIHSVDSINLAEELNRQAWKLGKTQGVLIQVKLSEEKTKHGINEGGLLNLIERIKTLDNLRLEGFMTMPPYIEEPEMVRPYFRRLREIREDINSSKVLPYPLHELSMGMSHDFEVAIEEGATIVRVGTAIFGNR